MNESIIGTIVKLNEICNTDNAGLCRSAGISQRESSILISINPGDRITCNALSERMELSPSRVSRLVDKLLSKGYLLRKISERDRRAIEISLSEAGAECRKKILRARNHCEKRIRSKLDKKELKAVQNGLVILRNALNGMENEQSK